MSFEAPMRCTNAKRVPQRATLGGSDAAQADLWTSKEHDLSQLESPEAE